MVELQWSCGRAVSTLPHAGRPWQARPRSGRLRRQAAGPLAQPARPARGRATHPFGGATATARCPGRPGCTASGLELRGAPQPLRTRHAQLTARLVGVCQSRRLCPSRPPGRRRCACSCCRGPPTSTTGPAVSRRSGSCCRRCARRPSSSRWAATLCLQPAAIRLQPATLRLPPATLRLQPATLRLQPAILRLQPRVCPPCSTAP